MRHSGVLPLFWAAGLQQAPALRVTGSSDLQGSDLFDMLWKDHFLHW